MIKVTLQDLLHPSIPSPGQPPPWDTIEELEKVTSETGACGPNRANAFSVPKSPVRPSFPTTGRTSDPGRDVRQGLTDVSLPNTYG